VSTALGASWSVTTLTRGRSGSVPEGAHSVIGDRTQPDAYNGVADRDWDMVMDTSWQPGMVRSAVDTLSRQAGHWIYVSSVAVYAKRAHRGGDSSPRPVAAAGTVPRASRARRRARRQPAQAQPAVATRFAKLAVRYEATVHIAAINNRQSLTAAAARGPRARLS
jgi:hypothetical protein